MTFALDSRLAADTFGVGDLTLCRVLLMNDSRFPWLILVPRRADLSEIHDLSAQERAILIEEAAFAGERLKMLTGAKKINTAALGNMVSQLHVHVVARFGTTPPGPDRSGASARRRLTPESAAARLGALRAALGDALAPEARE